MIESSYDHVIHSYVWLYHGIRINCFKCFIDFLELTVSVFKNGFIKVADGFGKVKVKLRLKKNFNSRNCFYLIRFVKFNIYYPSHYGA